MKEENFSKEKAVDNVKLTEFEVAEDMLIDNSTSFGGTK
jgi:hypothetical protein